MAANNSSDWTAALSTLALLVIALFVVGDALFPNVTKRWEYTIVSSSDSVVADVLTKLGASGWELVFARRAVDADKVAVYEMIFKRSASALKPARH